MFTARLDTDHLHIVPDPAILGGKGAGLCKLRKLGFEVPEALVITTEEWQNWRHTGNLSSDAKLAVYDFLADYPNAMFSVRSGAPVSMPGMMDTILNVGVDPLKEEIYDRAYERFVRGWLEVVKGQDPETVNDLIKRVHARASWHQIYQGKSEEVTNPERRNKLLHSVLSSGFGVNVPLGRPLQVLACVEAVFQSWDTDRAKSYRKLHDIPEDMGTACVIQRMVMGTAPGLSGSGVMFTRDPATGAHKMTGEIAFNAQGEEVVAGTVTPISLDDLQFKTAGPLMALRQELSDLCEDIEAAMGDVQDIEFTVENGKVYLLQTRTAKMSARARIITAVQCAKAYTDDLVSACEYVQARVTKAMVEQTQTTVVKTDAAPIMSGLAASPGAVTGQIRFRNSPIKDINKKTILVCDETTPDDFDKMVAAAGILTRVGGFTSHAAVVARGIGKPAVVGCGSMQKAVEFYGYHVPLIDMTSAKLKLGKNITICGTTGNVWMGRQPVIKQAAPRELWEMLSAVTPAAPSDWVLEGHLFDNVALRLDPADMAQCETQMERAGKYLGQGKAVGFVIDVVGLGQDWIDTGVETALKPLKDNFGPDLSNEIYLGKRADVADYLNMRMCPEAVLDLLDALA